jgi:hypothetical protein
VYYKGLLLRRYILPYHFSFMDDASSFLFGHQAAPASSSLSRVIEKEATDVQTPNPTHIETDERPFVSFEPTDGRVEIFVSTEA